MSERRVELERLRDELKERLERYKAHRQRSGGPLDKDLEEQSVEVQNDEVVESLEAEAEEELSQVRHALARIREGQGDICESCGEVIDAGRLAAVPYASLCRECSDG